VKYRRSRNPKPKDIEGNLPLEVTWTVVPLVLFLSMFYFGWTNYEYLRSAPRDAMAVKVTARQWAWGFEYPNGRKTEELYLAVDRPVKLLIRSVDVIHGFYIPAFRIKSDAVPGKENMSWFTPTDLGAYDIECTVICGPSHSYMLSRAVVVPEDEFKRWYFGAEDEPPPGGKLAAAATAPAAPSPADPPGLAVLKARNCLQCHSLDGKVMVGPTFKGLFGSRQTVIVDGKEQVLEVDEAFLRQAIANPFGQRVKGYPPAMPLIPLSEAETAAVIEHVKGLK
jgi:cytochrome c oxidase subunit II